MTSDSLAEPLVLAEPERPFWGFGEVFLIAALFLPAVLAGGYVVQKAVDVFHGDAAAGSALVAGEFLGYGIIFLALHFLFARYGQPLFRSLAWVEQPFRTTPLVTLGVTLTVVNVLLGSLLQMPNAQTPFEKLLADPVSRLVIGLFGVTLGPIVEELLFRGFLQPVLVNTWGVPGGILVTAALFGAMHLAQNGWHWQSGVMIMLVGFVLGVVRHVSGSTRASAITHIAYNTLPFLLLLFSGNQVNLK